MKDFIVIANINVITYKEFFPMLKEDKARPGYVFNKTLEFNTPNNTTESKCGIAWYTTLPVTERRKLTLTKTYNPKDYPKYDNYDAIEVSRVKDIPYDYPGTMGVPITIFSYDLDDVEIDGCLYGEHTIIDGEYIKGHTPVLDGNQLYARILIKPNPQEIHRPQGKSRSPQGNHSPQGNKCKNYTY